ncbi:helix-turn-helix domain-containing protein [Mycobacterium frederiksbergense]|uniref:helix-turn-helix domain-containing protein n=1 Tax=Mycolicibacterium frederiksbergense TaxID=117567 RepID=UPI0021F2852A|nr:helix-turn-helix domain-containing protein [Mycolicibacterium frederiksbergense]MCV7043196.1 helix-turn-helix domain-containing protein [Mycolicibacterium frederiksbergense]
MTETTNQAPPLLTVKEAAAALRISEATLFAMLRRGEVTRVRFGRRVFIERDEIARVIASHRVA